MIILYFFAAVYGLAVGSFLNVCICRIPKGKSVVSPPSQCMECGTRLKTADLIPVFSYIFRKGRCKYCGSRISPRYPLVELITAAVFILLFARFDLSLELLAAVYLMSILIAVFFIDIDHREIPNELVLTGLAGGVLLLVYNLFQPVSLYGGRDWWIPLVGMFTGSGILFAVFLLGVVIYKSDDAMGMGDVKIFAPIGLFLGWKLTLVALFVAVFTAGFASLLLIIFRIKDRKGTIPFGPFIVAGVFIALMWGWELIGWYIG